MKKNLPPAQNPDEIFDVVDEADRVVSRATRAEVHAKKLLHRAVHILVAEARGNIVLQKRSLEKDTCPGLFSTSCAGHVDAGEDYLTAARRELGEELGVPAKDAATGTRFLFAMPPSPELGWEFIRVYFLRTEKALAPNPAEIDALCAFPPEEIDAQIAAFPQKFAESFRVVWREFRRRFPRVPAS